LIIPEKPTSLRDPRMTFALGLGRVKTQNPEARRE
jgi:hypothetical protein